MFNFFFTFWHGVAINRPWHGSRRFSLPSNTKIRFDPCPVHLAFFALKSSLGQVFIRILPPFPISSIQPVLNHPILPTVVILQMTTFYNSHPSFRATATIGPETSRSPSDTPHSVGPLWTSDHPVAETSTGQHTTLTKDKHPFSRRGIRTRTLTN
jgi:hypothetical protein